MGGKERFSHIAVCPLWCWGQGSITLFQSSSKRVTYFFSQNNITPQVCFFFGIIEETFENCSVVFRKFPGQLRFHRNEYPRKRLASFLPSHLSIVNSYSGGRSIKTPHVIEDRRVMERQQIVKVCFLAQGWKTKVIYQTVESDGSNLEVFAMQKPYQYGHTDSWHTMVTMLHSFC